jgi:hypothetical protein
LIAATSIQQASNNPKQSYPQTTALQTKIRIRRYVDVHYLRHNNINDLDPNIAIGPRAGAEREWDELRAVIAQEKSCCHTDFAGGQSYLSRTVEAELLIDNIKTRSHNLYRKGRELERM